MEYYYLRFYGIWLSWRCLLWVYICLHCFRKPELRFVVNLSITSCSFNLFLLKLARRKEYNVPTNGMDCCLQQTAVFMGCSSGEIELGMTMSNIVSNFSSHFTMDGLSYHASFWSPIWYQLCILLLMDFFRGRCPCKWTSSKCFPKISFSTPS